MVVLRLATIKDLTRMFEWRNNPQVFGGFYNQSKPLTWQGHIGWWNNRKSQRCFIILYEREMVGVVNATHLDTHCPEVGYYIGETALWGRGVATEAVGLALGWLESQGYTRCCATVFKKNIASIRVLAKLGFQRASLSNHSAHPTKGIHLRYEKKLVH